MRARVRSGGIGRATLVVVVVGFAVVASVGAAAPAFAAVQGGGAKVAELPVSGLNSLAGSDSVVRIGGDARISSESVNMGLYDSWPASTASRATIRVPHAKVVGTPPWTWDARSWSTSTFAARSWSDVGWD